MSFLLQFLFIITGISKSPVPAPNIMITSRNKKTHRYLFVRSNQAHSWSCVAQHSYANSSRNTWKEPGLDALCNGSGCVSSALCCALPGRDLLPTCEWANCNLEKRQCLLERYSTQDNCLITWEVGLINLGGWPQSWLCCFCELGWSLCALWCVDGQADVGLW